MATEETLPTECVLALSNAEPDRPAGSVVREQSENSVDSDSASIQKPSSALTERTKEGEGDADRDKIVECIMVSKMEEGNIDDSACTVLMPKTPLTVSTHNTSTRKCDSGGGGAFSYPSVSRISSQSLPYGPNEVGAFAIENPLFLGSDLPSNEDPSQSSQSASSENHFDDIDDAESNSNSVSTEIVNGSIDNDPESSGLCVLEATCVNDIQVVQGEAVKDREQKSCRKNWVRLAVATSMFLVVALVLGLTMRKRMDKNMQEHSTKSQDERIREIVIPLSGENVFDSSDEGFSLPRFEALKWLSNFENRFPDWKIRQRYVLAVLYFSTNGPEWMNKFSFLSDRDECGWSAINIQDNNYRDTERFENHMYDIEGVVCNRMGEVETIRLGRNNILGTIPHELSYFAGSLLELNLDGGSLSGSIPQSFEDLRVIESLILSDNCLTGTVPDLSRPPKLEKLSVENNLELRGSLNGFCSDLSYKNSVSSTIRITCDKEDKDKRTSSIECDCCICCFADDPLCLDPFGNTYAAYSSLTAGKQCTRF